MLRAFLAGTFAIAALSQEAHVVDPPPAVRDVRMQLARGRITELAAAEGAEWVRRRAREIGPDGDRVGLVDFNTNPFTPANGVGIDIGSNWENGASNRADADVADVGPAARRDGHQWGAANHAGRPSLVGPVLI